MTNKLEHHQNHAVAKKEIFEKLQPTMEQIYEKGFSGYLKTLNPEELRKAFITTDRHICCMDEGTPGGLHSAGSGILRKKEDVIAEFKAAGVTEITSHDGCGAAGLYAKANNLDPHQADEYGKKWSQEIAAELGVPHRHIKASEMNRPDFHVARVAYYDGTGAFDYSKVKQLPEGFIISRALQGLKASVAEANIAYNIATGDHGLGSLVNKENPFVVVAIAKDHEQLAFLMNELEEVKRATNDSVKIDGFVRPIC